jgi:hypothetical protein
MLVTGKGTKMVVEFAKEKIWFQVEKLVSKQKELCDDHQNFGLIC